MDKKLKKVLVPGWAVMPELYGPLIGDPGSDIYDFSFFSGESTDQLVNFDSLIGSFCDSPCVLHAHSLGAMLCIGALPRLPNVKALIIYSGFAKFARTGEDNPYGQPPEIIGMMKRYIAENPESLVKNFYRTMFHPERYAGAYPGILNIACLACGLGTLSANDCRANVAGIRIPVLLLHGAKDRVADVKLAEELASALLDSRLHVIDDAGHALPFTHADKCRTLTGNFFSDHDIK